MAVFFLLFGNMVNGFGKNQADLNRMLEEVAKYSLFFVYLGLVVCMSSYAAHGSYKSRRQDRDTEPLQDDLSTGKQKGYWKRGRVSYTRLLTSTTLFS